MSNGNNLQVRADARTSGGKSEPFGPARYTSLHEGIKKAA